MPYRLKAGEAVPEGIRRIATEEIASAVERLSKPASHGRAEAIHEARKSIKKVRGILKLMRPELDAAYRRENARLRDIGRRLSDFRDADAIIETFDSVVGKYKQKLQSNTLAAIRRGLSRDKREKEKSENVARVMAQSASGLRGLLRSVRSWPLQKDGFTALAPGLKQTYRDGREVMRAAARTDRPEDYHEWRKRAKDHWYHVRLMESLWTEVMQAREAGLHDLETWLGDDHNLVVLCDRLRKDPDRYGGEGDVQLFTTLAHEQQNELRAKAKSLGERVYEQKPKLFVRDIEKLWDAWQNQPPAMKAQQKEQRREKQTAA